MTRAPVACAGQFYAFQIAIVDSSHFQLCRKSVSLCFVSQLDCGQCADHPEEGQPSRHLDAPGAGSTVDGCGLVPGCSNARYQVPPDWKPEQRSHTASWHAQNLRGVSIAAAPAGRHRGDKAVDRFALTRRDYGPVSISKKKARLADSAPIERIARWLQAALPGYQMRFSGL